jgi:Family of unknown function (DUF6159)
MQAGSNTSMSSEPAVGGTQGEGRIARSWRLTSTAWELMRTSRAMLVIALIQTITAIAALAAILYFTGYFDNPSSSRGRMALVGLITLYPLTFVSVFFGVALASAAVAAMDGRRLSVREALGAATGRLGAIALWSLLAAGVGALLNEIERRLPLGGRITGWLVGAAWSLATIFVIPLLAVEGVGPITALRRSAQLLKSRWGEGLAGSLTILAWTVIAFIPAAIIVGSGVVALRTNPGLGVALIAAGVLILVLINAMASGVRQVFAVGLYRFAASGEVRLFPRSDLEDPFTLKRRRGSSSSLPHQSGTGTTAIPAGTVDPHADEEALGFEVERAEDDYGSSWEALGNAYGTGSTAAEAAVLAVATTNAVYRARPMEGEGDWLYFFAEPEAGYIHRRAPL